MGAQRDSASSRAEGASELAANMEVAPEKRRRLEASGSAAAATPTTAELTIAAAAGAAASLPARAATMAALQREGTFCDVLLRCSDGVSLQAHAVVLATVVGSRVRGKLLEDSPVDETKALRAGATGATSGDASAANDDADLPRRRLCVEVSSAAVQAMLTFVYCGEVSVPARLIPELLRVAKRWEIPDLSQAVVRVAAANLSPALVAELFAIGESLGGKAMSDAYAYLLANFPAIVEETDAFGRWPAPVLEKVLRSDDLAVESEESVLQHVLRWCGGGDSGALGRKALAVLDAVRWPLLSLATLEALADAKAGASASGSLRAAVAERAEAAKSVHAAAPAAGAAGCRKAYAGWWPGLGSCLRGVAPLAGRGAEGKAGETELRPRAIRPHEGTLLFLDVGATKGPGRVLQWFVRAKTGRSVAGAPDFEELADVWSGPGDAFYLLDRDAETVVRVKNGESEVVGSKVAPFKLNGACALAVGSDHSVYVLESYGARVLRYTPGGRVTTVAGAAEPGTGAAQLNAGLSGRVFVGAGDAVYVADTGNHRVQRWDPGAREGVTVAGGRGCGAGSDQLSHPGGVWVLKNGVVYVADTGNHRVVKWREGAKSGSVVAGGCGPGDGHHQLREPLDVALDSQGALLVADLGNSRVMRWPPPTPHVELLAAVRS
eukprot:TRINITY_DN11303_c0_g1_i1.p1 TRINITY_DN11303_c0_g1~~TRINITY_DN11303_c0_g1_i1.p1  ORF type:complete len:664 (-),score=160.70 TRINITY_DN11303_c0_g1_i1:91-2082(-)